MGKITIKGEINSTAQLGCKIKIDPTMWNATSQRCCGKSRKAVDTNREIESLLLLIRQRFDELNSKLTKFTATDVKKLLQGVASEQETILGVFQAFNEQYQLRVGVNRAKGSYLQYQNTYRILSKFITFKYKVSDIAIKALDALFIENFATYLAIEEKKQAKTINGHLVRLKTIGKSIVHQGIVGVSPFKEYKVVKPERKLRHLHRHELEQIMATTFDEPNVMFTRDVFIFSCFTGISYCDMLTLTKQHLKRDDNGNLWIMINRQKTGVPENVLLLDIAVELIEKYSGADIKGRLFPMMKILTLNTHLKKIARGCGIERNLTYHVASHTANCYALKISTLPLNLR